MVRSGRTKKPRQSNASAKRRTKEVICHAARKRNRFPGITCFHQAAACLHDPALYIGFSFHYAHQYADHGPDLLGGRNLCGGGNNTGNTQIDNTTIKTGATVIYTISFTAIIALLAFAVLKKRGRIEK